MAPPLRTIDWKLHLALAFAMPWNATSLMFVVLSSLLLAGIESRLLFAISLIPAFFLISWLFNYAFEVLDHSANGGTTTPTASIEVISPFQWRPLVQVAISFLIVLLGSKLGTTGNVIIILLLLVQPASIAILSIGDGVLQAVNPFALWRLILGMGVYYLLVLAVIGLFAALAVTLQRADLWPFARYVLLEIGVLTVFAVLGTSIFLRRIEIGFQPRSSPERKMELNSREHLRQLDAILDEAYGQTRIKDYERAASTIKRWLADTHEGGGPNDTRIILQRVKSWGDPAAFKFIEGAIGAPSATESNRQSRT